MKKLIALLLALSITFLTFGCDETSTFLTTTETSTTTEPKIYTDMPVGDLAGLNSELNKVNQEFFTVSKMTIYSTTEATIQTGSYIQQGNISTSMMYLDLEDFYILCYDENASHNTTNLQYIFENNGSIIEYTKGNNNEIIEKTLFDEFTLNNIYEVLEYIGFSSEDESNYLGNIERESYMKYVAQIGYTKWNELLGSEFMDLFEEIHVDDFDEYPIQVEYSFNPDYRGYTVTINLDITGDVDGNSVRIKYNNTQVVKIRAFDHQTVSQMGFYIPVSETIEGIEYDSRVSSSVDYFVYSDTDNWIRFYLKPGYYKLTEIDGLQILNEDMEDVPINYPLHITEEGYYYFNLYTDYDKRIHFYIGNLGIQDIMELTLDTDIPGEIEIISEGKNDINNITFLGQRRDYLLLLNFDLSNSDFSAFEMYIIEETFCTTLYDECYYYLPKDEEVKITIRTDISGSVDMNYSYIPFQITSQLMINLKDISEYNENNPVKLGQGVEFVIFTITLDHDGKYSIFNERMYGYGSNIVYDIYTLDGVQLNLDGINGDNLEQGTYIVKMYYSYGSSLNVFYPYLHEWD